uniref:EGF-like domain-containing protein n=1 Tax=Caenorhabditis tropicalis TaxID=1561998 RepID=A0A1I7U7G3_9PELO
MRSNSSSRLWVGPLMLVIIIALIYLLSLMPTTPPHLANNGFVNDGHTEYAMNGQPQSEWQEPQKNIPTSEENMGFDSCRHGGITNETDGSCVCTRWYSGDKCETPVCMNDGLFNHTLGRCVCTLNWVGEHCTFRCNSGVVNKTTGFCECLFGRPCTIQKCINGHFFDGKCSCYEGFTGPACTICDGTVPSIQCDDVIRKRGSVNSRLTLSGLSFCIITIGLLCVGAHRRRSAMNPMAEDTWYRVFHPNNNRPFRCRHDYMCGGSWVPRDRALIVAPGRVSMSSTTPRVHRLATPPPSYTSVDDLNNTETQSPPTYEEATRIEIENVVAEETESEEAKDDVVHEVAIEIPTSSEEEEEVLNSEETTEITNEST